MGLFDRKSGKIFGHADFFRKFREARYPRARPSEHPRKGCQFGLGPIRPDLTWTCSGD